MSKKSHHFLTLWPWPLTYDLEKLIRSGHYHYQCVCQIWEQSIPWFLSYRVNTIAGGGRLRRKTITSPDPSDTGDIIIDLYWIGHILKFYAKIKGSLMSKWFQHLCGMCGPSLRALRGNHVAAFFPIGPIYHVASPTHCQMVRKLPGFLYTRNAGQKYKHPSHVALIILNVNIGVTMSSKELSNLV